MTSEELARLFHETYEDLAPKYGHETREASRKPWQDVPENNRQLMVAVAERILQHREARKAKPRVQSETRETTLKLLRLLKESCLQCKPEIETACAGCTDLKARQALNSLLAEEKEWNIWSEGYSATGESAQAHCHGQATAATFKAACRLLFAENKNFDEEKMTYWGCRLFDNETDARKTFG